MTGVGRYLPDWKYKAVCRNPQCGRPLSSSVSKTAGFCSACGLRASRMGPRRRN